MPNTPFQSLGDIRDRYLASLDQARQRQADIRSATTQMARALSGQPDPAKVRLSDLRRWRPRMEGYFQGQLEQRKLRKGAVQQYLSRVQQMMDWFPKTYPEAAATIFDPDADEKALILQGRATRGGGRARGPLRQLFRLMAQEGLTKADLSTHGPRLMTQIAADLERRRKGWKAMYTTLCRAVVHLQESGAFPDFELPPQAYQREGWMQSWEELRNSGLKEALATYIQKASDPSLMAREWPRGVVDTSTRDRRIFAVEHFVSVVEREGWARTELLSPDEIFSEDLLFQYAMKCLELRDGVATTGLNYRLRSLKAITKALFDFPPERFERVIGAFPPRRLKDKQARLTTLDDHLDLLDFIGRQAHQAEQRSHQLSLERLAMLQWVNLFGPVREDNLLTIQLGKHLQTETETGIWELHFTAEETKTHKPQHFEVAESLRRRLENYLETTRKEILAGVESPYLFPTSSGKPLERSHVDKQLKDLDVAFRQVDRKSAKNVHLVRDLVVATCAVEMDNGIYNASKLLGHRSAETTRDSYFGTFGREQLIEEEDMERLLKTRPFTLAAAQQVGETLSDYPQMLKRFVRALNQQESRP